METAVIVQDLVGKTCMACERPKASGFSFCSDYYYLLPEGMRRALYRRVGRGYEQAFKNALAHLQRPKNG